MELDKRILSLRTEKGYTQERLAGILGVSTAAVSKWECANAYPDITLLPKIAEVFDVSVDYLLGYDMKDKKSVSDIVSEANSLRKGLKGDEAEELICRALARYPNNMQLIFELARHRFVNARYKKKAERESLLTDASEGFRYVAEHDEYKARRDWSYHCLSTISLISRNFDEAEKYNSKLLCAKGLYPRVNAAVIKLNRAHDENALRSLKEGVYSCIVELTCLMPWLTAYYMGKGDYESVINENLRAAKVYEEYSDCGWIYNELSVTYETLAFAFAGTGEYDECLDYLEKACECALKYDGLDYDLTYNIYDIPDGIDIEEKIQASESLLRTLTSPEREIYAPVREKERYKALISKLNEGA